MSERKVTQRPLQYYEPYWNGEDFFYTIFTFASFTIILIWHHLTETPQISLTFMVYRVWVDAKWTFMFIELSLLHPGQVWSCSIIFFVEEDLTTIYAVLRTFTNESNNFGSTKTHTFSPRSWIDISVISPAPKFFKNRKISICFNSFQICSLFFFLKSRFCSIKLFA